MKKLILSTLTICLIGCTSIRQETQEITITTNDATERKLMLIPMGSDEESVYMTMDEDNTFRATVSTSERGFYNLVSIKGYSQTILPYYVPVTDTKSTSYLHFGGQGNITIDGSKDNSALAAYATINGNINRALWNPKADLSNPTLLKSFISKADSIIDVYNCSKDVKAYLGLWSYICAYDNYASVQRILQVKPEEMPYQLKDILPEPHTVLDSPLAALFTNTPHIVFSSLPNQTNFSC